MEESRVQRDRYEKKPKNHKKRNIILSIIAVLVLIILGFGAYKFAAIKGAVDNSYKDLGVTKERDTSKLLSQKKPISILLMGTDTGELGRTDQGRTDSMMVITINPQTKKTLITSIPRDTAVNIPGFGDEGVAKINAAFAYGGAKTSIETVQKMLNIPIDFYAVINMHGLEQIINQIGGVTIKPLLSFDYEGYHFTKGEATHMNGKKALAYTRMRYDDPENDYGREKRQRQVLEEVAKDSGSVDALLNAGFINSLSKSTQTDMTFGDLTSIAKGYLGARDNMDNTYVQGQSGKEINDAIMQVTPESELQNTTNQIRNNLGLPAAQTGEIAVNN
ncbi:LCP family protein [Fructilactobacillus frigidiflavus]|uniref:LCP family glycopolymer transferase n=1 Tax=Fructilactobacillus frigidiflavus TaxID=3242688 RepID=UPI003756E09F